MQPSKWGKGAGGVRRCLGVTRGRQLGRGQSAEHWGSVGTLFGALGEMEAGIGFRGQELLGTGKGTHFLTLCPELAEPGTFQLCHSVCTTPAQLREVRETAQDGTAINGQNNMVLTCQGPW